MVPVIIQLTNFDISRTFYDPIPPLLLYVKETTGIRSSGGDKMISIGCPWTATSGGRSYTLHGYVKPDEHT